MDIVIAVLNILGLGSVAWWIFDTNSRLDALQNALDEVEEDIEEIYSNDYPPVLPDNKE